MDKRLIETVECTFKLPGKLEKALAAGLDVGHPRAEILALRVRRGQFRTKAAGLFWVVKSDGKNVKIRHDTLSRAGCGVWTGRFDSDEITEAPQSQIEILQQDGMKDLSARPLMKYKPSLTLLQTDHPRLHNVVEDCIRSLKNG